MILVQSMTIEKATSIDGRVLSMIFQETIALKKEETTNKCQFIHYIRTNDTLVLPSSSKGKCSVYCTLFWIENTVERTFLSFSKRLSSILGMLKTITQHSSYCFVVGSLSRMSPKYSKTTFYIDPIMRIIWAEIFRIMIIKSPCKYQ